MRRDPSSRRHASPIGDQQAFWLLLQAALDERRDPFDDEQLVTWMTRHADDARAAARLNEAVASVQIAAGQRARRRALRLPVAIAVASIVVLGGVFAWRTRFAAPPTDATRPLLVSAEPDRPEHTRTSVAVGAHASASSTPVRGRVLAFEARSVVVHGDSVEVRVIDLHGERVTSTGPGLSSMHQRVVASLATTDPSKRGL
jgi:hypothetical protein